MIYHTRNLTGCLVVLKSEASMRRFLGDRQRSVESKMRKAIKGGRRAGYPEADALIEEIMNLYYEKGYVLKQFAVESKPLQLYVAVMEHPDV